MAVTARNNGFRKVAKWIVGAVVVASASNGIVMAEKETPEIPEIPEEEETKMEVTEVPEQKQTKTEVPAVPEGGDRDAGEKSKDGSGATPAEPKQQKSSSSAEKDWKSSGDFSKANVEDWMHDSFINSKGPVGIGKNVAENAAFRIAQREGKQYVPPTPAANPKQAAEATPAAAPAQ
ncbi:hypothetical protein BBOV_II000730 [Babesia bovis T2Bo]|uniref:Uncharacterized protein n=1 Tax=Babesia bovis TaxID=5865 RepID=A7ASX2_BABBO|nr:hypothetical protein BBOV_II000730 [Babesia bovis T2Bo]EDO06033.1 hypothetical protein BBOV_II000730 [Babesia bovis T2Bo]BAN65128.1 hypothetical protein [Babesia bovis]BAN66261.1 hypothetical protein [Babesia bovis]|eukprot:XP_001609601.1 hypothetical protein [Babesia bovis T2Bo]